jgi:hypothetical protein
MSLHPYYPEVVLKLELGGEDGNKHIILAKVMRLLHAYHKQQPDLLSKRNIQQFREDVAAVFDYNAFLAVVAKWINFNDGAFLPHLCWIEEKARLGTGNQFLSGRKRKKRT